MKICYKKTPPIQATENDDIITFEFNCFRESQVMIGCLPQYYGEEKLATENDSWLYQAFRGPGNIMTETNNASMLMLGGGFGGVAVVAMSPVALALYTQYGPVLSSMGLTSIQQAHAWMTTVGYDKAGRFLNHISNMAQGTKFFYYRNAYQINDMGNSYLSRYGLDYTPNTNIGRGVVVGTSLYDRYKK